MLTPLTTHTRGGGNESRNNLQEDDMMPLMAVLGFSSGGLNFPHTRNRLAVGELTIGGWLWFRVFIIVIAITGNGFGKWTPALERINGIYRRGQRRPDRRVKWAINSIIGYTMPYRVMRSISNNYVFILGFDRLGFDRLLRPELVLFRGRGHDMHPGAKWPFAFLVSG